MARLLTDEQRVNICARMIAHALQMTHCDMVLGEPAEGDETPLDIVALPHQQDD